MEGRLKFIVGILILAVVVTQGMKILEKKALRKSKLAAGAEVSVPAAETKVNKTTSVTSEESPATAVVPEKVPEVVAKLSLAELEAEGKKPLCESDWEKGFCPRLTSAIMAVKGTRILNNRLMVFVDNEMYLVRADRYVNPPVEVDPTKPVEFIPSGDQAKHDGKRMTIAGALFLKDLIQSFKADVKDRNLDVVFLKNPTSPRSRSTFAFECSDGPLQSTDAETTFSEERLKSLSVDISQICRPL